MFADTITLQKYTLQNLHHIFLTWLCLVVNFLHTYTVTYIQCFHEDCLPDPKGHNSATSHHRSQQTGAGDGDLKNIQEEEWLPLRGQEQQKALLCNTEYVLAYEQGFILPTFQSDALAFFRVKSI